MAEQVLHGSNVVTTAEQGRRERVTQGMRRGWLRDTCLFHGTFEGSLKGLVPQLQTLADPHARSIQKLGEQTMLPFQKTEDANHLIRGQHNR